MTTRGTIDIVNLQMLKDVLQRFGIDPEGFNRGKTVEDLWSEIEAGESVLKMEDDGTLTRTVTVAKAVVIYLKPGELPRYLHEAQEIFSDGRTRQRQLGFSMAEKFKPGEEPHKAMLRGLREELSIECTHDQLQMGPPQVNTKDSASYPGLTACYRSFWFTVNLTDEQLNPNGYTEVTDRKTTTFEWRDTPPQKK